MTSMRSGPPPAPFYPFSKLEGCAARIEKKEIPMSKPLPTLTAEELEEIGTKAEDGFGCLKTAKGPLPLKAMDIQGKIEGLVAEVDVRQTFVNNLEEPLEATYIFPLPDRAAVTSFRMEISWRVVEGLLKERGEARREYDEAIQRGHRAAIAEEERPSVFTLRVGNLMAGEEGKVHLKLIGPIPVSTHPYSCSSPAADSPGGCEATFRFPLVVAPRYIPGVPLSGEPVGDGTAFDTDAAPDASRITPPVLLP